MSREAGVSAIKQPPVFILPNTTQLCWPIPRKFEGTLVLSRYLSRRWVETKKDTLLFTTRPTGQLRDCITDMEEFQSLSGHRIYHSPENPWDKAPGKTTRLYSVIYGHLHYHLLPDLRMKSWVLPFSSRNWSHVSLSNSWCQKICNEKSLWCWEGKKPHKLLPLFSAHVRSPWSQMFHPFQEGNTETQTTNWEQQVPDNRDLESRSSPARK